MIRIQFKAFIFGLVLVGPALAFGKQNAAEASLYSSFAPVSAVTATTKKLSFINHGFALKAEFDSSGVRYLPLNQAAMSWEWKLSFDKIEGSNTKLDSVSPQIRNNRIEYQRGDFVEWYTNGPQGIEQGFTLQNNPRPDSESLKLTMNMSGTLVGESENNKLTVKDKNNETILQYAKLHTYDARHRSLPSALYVEGSKLIISVDLRNAVFPIVIDPTTTTTQLVIDSAQANARFGASMLSQLDVNGDGITDLLVGAPLFDGSKYDEGAAFLYLGQANSPGSSSPTSIATSHAWSFVANTPDARFATDMVNLGDINNDGLDDVAISAPYDGENAIGAIYVFLGNVSTGLESEPFQVIFSESNQVGSGFGSAITSFPDQNGDGISELIIGSPLLDWPDFDLTDNKHDGIDAGLVSYYQSSESGYVLKSNLGPDESSTRANSKFGSSLSRWAKNSVDGPPFVVVGAPGFSSSDALVSQGAAFILKLNVAGLLIIDPNHSMVGDSAGSSAGFSVAVLTQANNATRTTVAIGAPTENNGIFGSAGAVYLYNFNKTTPTPVAQRAKKITIPKANASFGARLFAIPDKGPLANSESDLKDELMVAAPGFTLEGNRVGAVFTYISKNLNYSDNFSWWQAERQIGNGFGNAFSDVNIFHNDIQSEYVLSNSITTGKQFLGGKVSSIFMNELGDILTPAIDYFPANGNNVGNLAGTSFATGDINDDGFEDLVIGLPGFSDGRRGKIEIYLSTGSPKLSHQPIQLYGDANSFGFGTTLLVHDFNNDNAADIVVGAPNYTDTSTGNYQGGAVYLYMGVPNAVVGSILAPTQVIIGNNSMLGSSLAATNYKGDGTSELIVGAKNHLSQKNSQVLFGAGAVLVYDFITTKIIPDGEVDEVDVYEFIQSGDPIFAPKPQSGAHFGFSLAVVGDYNLDGKNEFVVGAPYQDYILNSATLEDAGAAYVIFEDLSLTKTLRTPEKNAQFGWTVASAGKLDTNPGDEILISAINSGANKPGTVSLFLSSSLTGIASTTQTANRIFSINSPLAKFGSFIYGTQDINNDGVNDLIVGAPSYSPFDNPFDTNTNSFGGVFYFLSQYNQETNKVEVYDSAVDGIAVPNKTGTSFGEVIGTITDQNNDGKRDLLISAPGHDDVTNSGIVYVVENSDALYLQAKPVNASPSTGETVDSYTIQEDGEVVLNGVLSNDTDDADITELELVTVKFSDKLSGYFLPENGKYTYIPNPSTYPSPQDLVELRLNGQYRGEILFENGEYKYIPEPDFYGLVLLDYLVKDANNGNSWGPILITVQPVADTPIVEDAEYSIDPENRFSQVLKGTDIDRDQLEFEIVSHPQFGSVTLVKTNNGNTLFDYVPDKNKNTGIVQFTYRAYDGQLYSETKTITLSFNGNNATPSVPELVSPTIDKLVTSKKLLLEWKPSIDPDGDDIQYTIHYCNNADFIGCNNTPKITAPSGKTNKLSVASAASGVLAMFGLLGSRTRREKFLRVTAILMLSITLYACGEGDKEDEATEIETLSYPITLPSTAGAELKYFWKITASDGSRQITSPVWQFYLKTSAAN
ncbi:MAG: FG-GAP-like repeat-containing protein [Gammaproteobacteria bacterium]|nr:FG-GAP-like repeat-containing protein [Gammaproteobacteria bacterium]